MNPHFKSLFLLYVFLNLQCQYGVLGAPQVPCFFIFGNSFAENGNNNYRATIDVNYKPYGIDFPEGPTGRFSNGRNFADFIAKYLDFDHYIPPFKNTSGFNILQGVNYASGGAGIRNETGKISGDVISLNEQLENHDHIISQIRGLVRNDSATKALLESCLYVVEIGTNDYMVNYFSAIPSPIIPSPTRLKYTPQQYAIVLNKQLSSQLKSLYDKGARKIAVFGVGSIGCSPFARATFDTQGSPCVDKINDAVQLFNIGLKSLVQDLNANFTDAKFIMSDIFQISTDTRNQGDLISDVACCKVKPNNLVCIPFGKVCANRTQYIYWDGLHPTETEYMAWASRSFNAQRPNDTYPFDISHLVQLNLT